MLMVQVYRHIGKIHFLGKVDTLQNCTLQNFPPFNRMEKGRSDTV